MFRFSGDGLDANRRNLGWLLWLRGILVVLLLLAAVLVQQWFEYRLLSNPGVLLALGMLTVLNLLGVIRLWKGPRSVTEAELLVQLALDVLLVMMVLYFTGGSTNPLVSWFLVPVTIAATILRRRHTLVVLAMAVSAYSWLLFHYQPFSLIEGGLHVPLAASPHEAGHLSSMAGMSSGHDHHADSEGGFSLHVFGMWLNFLMSATLIAFFVSRMSHVVREQDRVLSDQREDLLASEQLVMLGTLAASAAHELGTPLNTMTVLLDEMAAEAESGSAQAQDLGLMRQQLGLCRDILQGLRRHAEAGQGQKKVSLSGFLDELIHRVEVLHPRCRIDRQDPFGLGERVVDVPPALPSVIMNLLHNAAEASRETVSIILEGDKQQFCLLLDDDGDGIKDEVLGRLGQPFVSTKTSGLGIGLFLSHAALNRLGGSIRLSNRPEGGTRTELTLPWSALNPQEDGAK